MRCLQDVEEFTDKYFQRSLKVLQAEGVNPYLRIQTFLRGSVKATGIREALEILDGFSDLKKNGGHVFAVPDGAEVAEEETVLLVEGHVQDFILLETIWLGVLSEREPNLEDLTTGAREIVRAAGEVPVFYFGARHFPWWLDEQIAGICCQAGMKGCSTDRGARNWGAKGVGTTPHILILSFAAERPGNATVEAGRAFDRVMEPSVPRTLLIDTYNREVEEALSAAWTLGDRLDGVRLDTCWENTSQGAEGVALPELGVAERYLRGGGVTIAATWALRRALDENGHSGKTVFLSSGFDAAKTAAFVKAREVYGELHGNALFSGIGTGSLARGGRMATADVVQVRREGRWIDHAKTGRRFRPNPRLKKMW